MEESPEAVRAEDVENRLQDVELLFDDRLARGRGEPRVGSDGRPDRLAGLRDDMRGLTPFSPREPARNSR